MTLTLEWPIRPTRNSTLAGDIRYLVDNLKVAGISVTLIYFFLLVL